MTPNNWLNIARQASFNAILGTAMTFVILTGGIDLSVGSIVAVSSVVGGLLIIDQGWWMWPAVLVMLAAGALCGLCNGLIITLGGIPPFIVTLGTMQIFRGRRLAADERSTDFRHHQSAADFEIWGTRNFAGIPSPVIITAVVFIIGFLILRYTRLGLYTYAIGGNEQATRFSGVNISGYKLAVYTLMGLAAGIAGVMLTSRLNSAQPNVANGAELDAIAAVVIGGTSLFGGAGHHHRHDHRRLVDGGHPQWPDPDARHRLLPADRHRRGHHHGRAHRSLAARIGSLALAWKQGAYELRMIIRNPDKGCSRQTCPHPLPPSPVEPFMGGQIGGGVRTTVDHGDTDGA